MGISGHRFLTCMAVATLATGGGVATAAPAHAQAADLHRVDIPAGSIGAAIARLGRQTSTIITADPALLRGIRTDGLRGSYTTAQALAALLNGTRLVASADGRGGYAVVASGAVSAAADETQVAEIVVTATSVATIGETPILTTPRTVSAIGAKLIENIAPTSLQEVTKLIPSLTPRSGYSDPQQQFMVRGISLGTSDYRRDGLPLRHAFMPIEEVDRIEVLQGVVDVTQAGEKSPGGIINFVPKHPEPGDFQRVTLGVNEYGNVNGHADINLALGDDYGLRANLAAEHIDLADRTHGSRYAAALAFRANLTPDLVLDLNGYYQRQSRDHVSGGFLPTIDDATGDAAIPRASYAKDYGQSWSYDRYERGVVEAKLSGDLGDGWSLIAQGHLVRYNIDSLTTSITGLQAGGDAGIFALGFPSRIKDAAARFAVTKEIEIASNVRNRMAVILDASTDSLDFAFAGQSVGSGNIYGDLTAPAPTFAIPATRRGNDLRVYGAGFANELTLFDRFTLTTGAKRVNLRSRAYSGGELANTTVISKWLPNIAGLLRITSDWTVYATYNQAVQAGGIVQVGSEFANAGETLPPLLSKTYEVGTKARIGGLLVTLSAFTFDQPSQIVVGNVVSNSGATRYRGLDFNLSGQVTPRLNVIAAATVVDATVQRTDDPTILGKVPGNVPEFTGSLYLDYRAATGLFLSGGVFHTARKPADDQNSIYVPGYTTFDLGARYETGLGGHKTTFRLSATNVTNKFYWASALFGRLQYGTPRMIKGSITVEY